MKEYDRVELINEREKYRKEGLKKGDKGTILGPERNGYFLVYFDGTIYQNADGVYCTTEIDAAIKPEDLKVLESHVHKPTYAVVVTEKEEYMKLNVHKGMHGEVLWGESSNKLALMIEFKDDATGKKFKTEILREDLKDYYE